MDNKVLCFSTGVYNWFVRLSEQLVLEPSTKIYPLPFLPNWCLGMAVVQGDVTGVIDLERLLGEANSILSTAEKVPLLVLKTPHKLSLYVLHLYGLQNFSGLQIMAQDLKANRVFGDAFSGPDGNVFYELNTSVLNILVENVSKQLPLEEGRFVKGS